MAPPNGRGIAFAPVLPPVRPPPLPRMPPRRPPSPSLLSPPASSAMAAMGSSRARRSASAGLLLNMGHTLSTASCPHALHRRHRTLRISTPSGFALSSVCRRAKSPTTGAPFRTGKRSSISVVVSCARARLPVIFSRLDCGCSAAAFAAAVAAAVAGAAALSGAVATPPSLAALVPSPAPAASSSSVAHGRRGSTAAAAAAAAARDRGGGGGMSAAPSLRATGAGAGAGAARDVAALN